MAENKRPSQIRKGPMGRRGPGMNFEKAKDFKKSIKELVKSLKPYYPLIIISLLLSMYVTCFTFRI